MTPDERQMIDELFERVRSFGPVDKDREADVFIGQLMRQTPDAGYKLVQSVLVQEGTINDQGGRIQDLEDQVRQLEDQIQQMQAPAARGGGSFLGGLRTSAQSTGSGVPVTSRSGGFGQAQPAPQQASPWNRSAPSYQQPAPPMQQQAPAPAAAGGGFLRSAMATAAGVAGGIFAANAIKDMMGGGSAHAGQQQSPSESSPYEVNQSSNESEQGNGYQSEESNDPGNFSSDDSTDL